MGFYSRTQSMYNHQQTAQRAKLYCDDEASTGNLLVAAPKGVLANSRRSIHDHNSITSATLGTPLLLFTRAPFDIFGYDANRDNVVCFEQDLSTHGLVYIKIELS